jgi:MHS family proline/betaine transporter-like MFS transporter
MSELFPTHARGSGLSLSYAIGVAIFGGFAPFIHEVLINLTGNAVAPALYLFAAGFVGLFALGAARRMGFR